MNSRKKRKEQNSADLDAKLSAELAGLNLDSELTREFLEQIEKGLKIDDPQSSSAAAAEVIPDREAKGKPVAQKQPGAEDQAEAQPKSVEAKDPAKPSITPSMTPPGQDPKWAALIAKLQQEGKDSIIKGLHQLTRLFVAGKVVGHEDTGFISRVFKSLAGRDMSKFISWMVLRIWISAGSQNLIASLDWKDAHGHSIKDYINEVVPREDLERLSKRLQGEVERLNKKPKTNELNKADDEALQVQKTSFENSIKGISEAIPFAKPDPLPSLSESSDEFKNQEKKPEMGVFVRLSTNPEWQKTLEKLQSEDKLYIINSLNALIRGSLKGLISEAKELPFINKVFEVLAYEDMSQFVRWMLLRICVVHSKELPLSVLKSKVLFGVTLETYINEFAPDFYQYNKKTLASMLLNVTKSFNLGNGPILVQLLENELRNIENILGAYHFEQIATPLVPLPPLPEFDSESESDEEEDEELEEEQEQAQLILGQTAVVVPEGVSQEQVVQGQVSHLLNPGVGMFQLPPQPASGAHQQAPLQQNRNGLGQF